MFAPGNVGVDASTAATAIALLAVLGEPVTYAFGPLLPADATTTVPPSAATSDATASGSSVRPKTEPSDRLITSAPSRTARLIASTTIAEVTEPVQPKTLYARILAFGA